MKKLNLIIISIIFLPSLLFCEAAIKGIVVNKEDGKPVPGVTVFMKDLNKAAFTGQNGSFELKNVPPGQHIIKISAVGWKTAEVKTSAPADNLRIELVYEGVRANEVYVYGASKNLEKITESPSAVTTYLKSDIRRKSRGGRMGDVFTGSTGIDILQNGANDFIINTRGFNGGLHRRVLVLQDGRDAAMPLLGAQEWNSFSLPPDEYSSIEFVRGPAAALYGANAFNGVINLISYSPKEALGTRASFLIGDYETYEGDIRHAGLITEKISYKVTLGYSHSLNYSNRRDSVKFLEYPGLALERRPITEDDRQTFAGYGTMRMDYDFDAAKKLTFEAGYSRSGNETFVFGLGRTLVKDTERPYIRLAYNSENINIHTHYMQRSVADSMWLLVPGAYLLDNSKDFFIDFQHNFSISDDFKFVWGVSEQLQLIRTSGTSIPDDVDADYTGVYGQVEWNINDMLKFVTSARLDYASIHETQFSPRAAVVLSLTPEHKLRFSAGRAFQRPNYSELYRLTPDAPVFDPKTGAPVNFDAVQKAIADSIGALTETIPDIDLKLNAFRANAVGNENLKVEKIVSYEIGYKGVFGENFYFNADLYYNRLNDFITNFLPGINPGIEAWHPALEGDLAEYNDLAYDMVMNALNPRDRQRLSILNGEPVFVVSNANVGEVDEYGAELEAGYYFTDAFRLSANYSYFGYDVVKSNVNQPILPNTSPHRFNMTAAYILHKQFDCSVTLQYSAGFDWLAGTYIGYVPEYTVVHLNAGAYVFDSFRLGLNIFNLFDRKFYQIFGGTYLPRYTTLRLSYEF